jgi:hypothetical protein
MKFCVTSITGTVEVARSTVTPTPISLTSVESRLPRCAGLFISSLITSATE